MTIFNTELACRQQQQDALNTLNTSLGGNTDIDVIDVYGNGRVKYLTISNASAAKLPENFAALFPQVEILTFENCENLTDLSPLCGMTNLKELHLDQLRMLRRFPQDICSSLNVLRVFRCSQLDYDCLHHLRNLDKFTVMDNISENIPLVIFLLSTLKRLSLCFDKVTSIPDELGSLKNLEYLFLHGSRIEKISPTIGNLVLLEELIFWCPKVTELPGEIGVLRKLKDLNFKHCVALTSIPAPLLKLPNLERLRFVRCTNLFIPDEDILECTDSLVSFSRYPEYSQTFRYMTRINRAGRRLLKKDAPLALWVPLLGRCSNDVDCLFFFLKEKQSDLVPVISGKRKASCLQE